MTDLQSAFDECFEAVKKYIDVALDQIEERLIEVERVHKSAETQRISALEAAVASLKSAEAQR
ncbi:hypothetical protein ASE63_06695 [Bosea sp. Root381]|uniref:hypothetical protein n=1 Tax=Bosea sp. Root381 TaxID=1736524 RepID=UPI0006FD2B8D|nr:hypothetical protein [Bosea sp. Root381]KRE05983.1 hypothetical protein ASE63_06695 [Bosea sp. Root381]